MLEVSISLNGPQNIQIMESIGYYNICVTISLGTMIAINFTLSTEADTAKGMN